MTLNQSASPQWTWRVAGCAAVAFGAIWVLSLLLGGTLGPLRKLGQGALCRSNLRYVSRAFLLYADDYDGTFSPAPRWMNRVDPYVGGDRRLHCPAVWSSSMAGAGGQARYGYAMNASLGGRVRVKIDRPAATPLVYDSADLSRSAADAITTLPRPGRHVARSAPGQPYRPANFVAEVDGHVDSRFEPP